MTTSQRRGALLVVFGFGLFATGVGIVLGAGVVRLMLGADASGWGAAAAIGVVAVGFAFVAGLVSEPLVSRWLAGSRPSD
ncbi:hypothetical protein K1W54_04230 [Micromonospora sp. CPCC 205371]|nr:hypothetical protein [Micromonospora sp. CPCC 205371]